MVDVMVNSSKRRLIWALSPDSRANRIAQLGRIADAEPLGSAAYFTHVGLLAFASVCGILLFGTTAATIIIFAYLVLFTVEKTVAAHAVRIAAPKYYLIVLGLLFLRALAYNLAVFYIWTIEGDVFKFAAAALLVAATINVLVYHATHLEIIAVVIIPIWLCYFAITALSFIDYGLAAESITCLIITICVLPYFLLALRSAHSQSTKHDILQQSFSHTQRMDALGQLVAGVAHDFNNILTVTRGNAELIADTHGRERDELVQEIIAASDRGSTLAGQLLAFGRKTELSPTPIRVDRLLAENLTMLRRVLPENIALTSSVTPNLPAIYVDKHQLETAIMNLVINARDAIDGNGQIDITAAPVTFHQQDAVPGQTTLEAGDYVMISISDTGSGIAEHLHDDIFNPFFTTKPTGKGSSLGLSMVIGFAEQSGGVVRLQSRIGQGTRFTLCLPAFFDGVTA